MGSFALKTVRRQGEPAPVLEVRGELDIYTTPELETTLADLAGGDRPGVVVDLGASEFVDASACRVLLRAARRLRAHDGQLVVVNQDAEVERIFEVMGLEEFLTVVPSRNDAREVLAAA